MGSEDDLKREKILDVAFKLFTRYGFKKTTIADIATAARIGKATIYNYFDNKEAVFASVVEALCSDGLRRIQIAVSAAPGHEDKIRAWATTRLAITKEALGEDQQITNETLFELLPMAERARQEYERKESALLEQVITEANQAGVFTVNDPSRAVAALSLAMRSMEPIYHRFFDPPDLDEVVKDLIELFIKGLTTS